MTLTDEQARRAYVEATNAIAETFTETVTKARAKRDALEEAADAEFESTYAVAYQKRKDDLASAEAKLNEVIEANKGK